MVSTQEKTGLFQHVVQPPSHALSVYFLVFYSEKLNSFVLCLFSSTNRDMRGGGGGAAKGVLDTQGGH